MNFRICQKKHCLNIMTINIMKSLKLSLICHKNAVAFFLNHKKINHPETSKQNTKWSLVVILTAYSEQFVVVLTTSNNLIGSHIYIYIGKVVIAI